MTAARELACAVCDGRGFFRTSDPHAWPQVCRICGGGGAFSFAELGHRVHVDPRRLRCVFFRSAHPKTAARVLAAIATLLPAYAPPPKRIRRRHRMPHEENPSP